MADEVKSGSYPAQEHTYPSKESEIVEFKEIIKRRGEEIEASKFKRRSYEWEYDADYLIYVDFWL